MLKFFTCLLYLRCCAFFSPRIISTVLLFREIRWQFSRSIDFELTASIETCRSVKKPFSSSQPFIKASLIKFSLEYGADLSSIIFHRKTSKRN